MYRALYPRDRYPLGHPDLSHSLNSLGSFLHAQGESGKAEPFFREALAMRRALYSRDRYPLGHPNLAFSLNNWGGFLHAQGEYSKAEPFLREALAMRQALYPKDKYPLGHPELATSMHNLGIVLARQGKYDTAEYFFRDALAMYRALHPREKNPHGHPDVANALNSIGGLLQDRGEYPKAASFMREALAMYQAVFPKDKYPFGHKNLALSHNNLGMVLLRWGKPGDAEPFLREALTMYQDLINCRTDTASEAEGLNYIATLPLFRDYFLSATRQLPPDPAAYDLIWKSKAALGRILYRRHLDRLALRDPDSRQLAQDLQSARRELARLLLQPLPDTDRQKKRLQQLTEEKEQLERSLAQRLRDTLPLPGPDQATPARLRARLPAHAVFIDLLHYWAFEQDPKVAGTKGERQTRSYVAFVVRPGQPVQRVELGEAEPIDQVLKQWRKEIAAWRPDRHNDPPRGFDQRLSQLVWRPLLKYIPPDTETVYLSPDGDLSALPWAALPGRDRGKVLLEEHALALVPHGPFLLERLQDKPLPIKDTDVLLTLGGVRYDQPPESIGGLPSQELMASDHTRGGSPVFWGYLPGTERELNHVRACAGPLQVLERTGAAASTTQLLADLPRARFAHLATHGFFDGQGTRSILQLTEEDFRKGRFGERIGVGARNPLYLSGLVLAGANRKDKDHLETYAPDGGILTAEELVDLPLEKLELVVLSACETGLGDVAAGEGVLGLQRAFHIAGGRNVVASLWQVDDEATAALMALFYHCLWQEKQPPLQALRTAQVTLYRHPERIPQLAQARGPKPDVVVKVPRPTPRGDSQDRRASHAGVKQWAGFVLSGPGR
jgi:CHAT domain-containing protein/Tfp pilus assembly protein PilF